MSFTRNGDIFMCAYCFEGFAKEDLQPTEAEGEVWDVCKPCWNAEQEYLKRHPQS